MGRLRGRTAKARKTTPHDRVNQSASERLKGIYERSRYLTPVPQSKADKLLQLYRLIISRYEIFEFIIPPVLARVTHTYRLDKKMRIVKSEGAK